MLAFIMLLLAVLLFGLLYLLARLYLTLISSFFAVGILIFGGWVVLNVLVLTRLSDHATPWVAMTVSAWEKVFSYTAPYQALMAVVLLFWSFAVVFNDIPAPETQAQFVHDFIVGTGWLAYVIYVVAFGGFGLFMSDAWPVRLFSIVYIVAVGAGLAVPCFFGALLERWIAVWGAGRVLAAAQLVFLVMSATGWMLYQAALGGPSVQEITPAP